MTGELPPDALRRRVDPASLPFETTADVPPGRGTIGQPRAIDAITFGLEIRATGYNIYVSGQPGSGRETSIIDMLAEFAPRMPTPDDWAYVHNFEDSDRPTAIRLPAGRGTTLAADMQRFVADAQREIPRAFDSEDYARRQRNALSAVGQRRDQLFEELQQFAATNSFTIQMTPTGIATIPVANDQPLSNEAYAQLPEDERKAIDERGQLVQEQLGSTMRKARELDREAGERVSELNREVALFAIGPLLDELRERYHDYREVLHFIDQVQEDVLTHYAEFRPAEQQQSADPAQQVQAARRVEFAARYNVNVLIDNGGTHGAPVVSERNPSYYNLIGRMEYRSLFGSMVTDFREIKPGALHRANGGFLVLHITDILRQPFAWDALKRALVGKEIRIEHMGEQTSMVPTATLRPEPIPLDIKVILIGTSLLYQTLYATDEEFAELFKVKAEFAPDMQWDDQNTTDYVAFISRQIRDNGLRHFDRSAVARVLEYSARLREDQRKLSTRMQDIANVITEASYWAGNAGHEIVTVDDVAQAILQKIHRANLIEERVQERLIDGTIDVETDGSRVGQINGLSVISIGDYTFGQPSRISARVALGSGDIDSIEREINQSGPSHGKGFLILSGYLRGQYGKKAPLAIRATITFEQSYNGVDGDSASSTELYALLSAIGEIPLRQDIAVTGSVDQYGTVQAVGGVTDKIEGFFKVCQARGLTGQQGVIVPATNVPSLMLFPEVVEAVEAGQFHIWAVQSIDEGIELLTGLPAGEMDADGNYPPESVHGKVAARLEEYAMQAQAFSAQRQAASPDGHGEPTPAPLDTKSQAL
ncbi:MAG: AAA family ATPase [Thermomicrobiales bacterium]|nr:AAA family ATPase [Thermomicrobiales bacterium]